MDTTHAPSAPALTLALEGSAAPSAEQAGERSLEWGAMIPFLLCHVAILGALFSGVTATALIVCAVLYFVRMFAVTGAYHRYFSHRAYKTSRVMQFILAFLAETSSQRGVLWWAAHHRQHHKYSDQEGDIHSPVLRGFWYSHVLWIYDHNSDTQWDRIKDFARYPELRWLNKYWIVPPILLGFFTWLLFGWSGLFIGFFLSTVLLWHGTFLVNSLTHVWGSRRYETTDDSRNNLLIALVTLGEGWHNNHHHYQSSTRQGFFWWEIDITYSILKVMSWFRLVWDLREPPSHIVAGKKTRSAA